MTAKDDIYRRTNAERLPRRQTHTARNVKGVLQEEGNSHQLEFWRFTKGWRQRDMVSCMGKVMSCFVLINYISLKTWDSLKKGLKSGLWGLHAK